MLQHLRLGSEEDAQELNCSFGLGAATHSVPSIHPFVTSLPGSTTQNIAKEKFTHQNSGQAGSVYFSENLRHTNKKLFEQNLSNMTFTF